MTAQDIGGSLHSEQVILSAIVQSPDILDTVLDLVDPAWFGGAEASAVARAILAIAERKGPLDCGSIIIELGPVHEAVIEWVWTLPTYGTASSRDTLAPHAEVIRQGHLRRWLAAQARAVATYASDTSMGADEAVEAATEAILTQPGEVQAARAMDVVDALRSVVIEASEAHTTKRAKMGITCGVYDLDRMTRGLHPSRLYTIGAATGMGKTAWMVWHAAQVVRHQDVHAIYVSVEVPPIDIARRVITAATGISAETMQDGMMSDGDIERMTQAVRAIQRDRLSIIDHRSGTIGAVRTAVRRYLRSATARTRPLGVVYVDYLQRFRPLERSRSREEEIAAMSRELHDVARTYEVAVVVGAQLNRELYKRASKKPMLSDLRESAAVEHDSNAVIMLHRPDVFDEEPRGVMQAIYVKNREGKCGTVELRFEASTGALSGIAREDAW